MRRISKNSDIALDVSTLRGTSGKFTATFYTTEPENYLIKRTSAQVVTDEDSGRRTLPLNWTELSTLPEGVLNYTVNAMSDDSDFDDGVYNATYQGSTIYYIVNDSDDHEAAIQEQIDELDIRVTENEQADAQRDTRLAELEAALTAETQARTDEDQNLNARVDELGNTTSTLSSELAGLRTDMGGESEARQNADTALGGRIDTLQSHVDSEFIDLNETDSHLLGRIETLETQSTALGGRIDSEAATRQQTDAQLSEAIQQARTDVTAAFAEVYENLSPVAQRSIQNETRSIQNENRINSVETKNTAQDTAISGLDTRVTALEQAVPPAYDDTEIRQVTSEALTDLRSIIYANERVTSEALTELRALLAGIDARLTAAETDITTLDTTMSQAVTQLAER